MLGKAELLKPKRIITVALLAFVAASVAFLVFEESAPRTESSMTASVAQTDQVVATYFHGRARCVTCQRLEAYAEDALTTGFQRELADGRLAWRVVDVSQPEDRHFVHDYQLQSQSVVLVEIKDGRQQRWRNLDQIWQKVSDKEAYIAYVHDEVRRFLTE